MAIPADPSLILCSCSAGWLTSHSLGGTPKPPLKRRLPSGLSVLGQVGESLPSPGITCSISVAPPWHDANSGRKAAREHGANSTVRPSPLPTTMKSPLSLHLGRTNAGNPGTGVESMSWLVSRFQNSSWLLLVAMRIRPRGEKLLD